MTRLGASFGTSMALSGVTADVLLAVGGLPELLGERGG